MKSHDRNSKLNLFITKLINKFFRSYLLNAIGEHSLSEIGKFERDGWDELLFRDLNLDRESRILVLGGYKGDSIHEYRKRYDCNVLALEPVKSFFEILIKRFFNDEKVAIQNLALAAESGQIEISVNADSTGFYEGDTSGNFETITCMGVVDFFAPETGVFDLVEMNIEGAEYEVLESILGSNFQSRIRTFLIQFHQNVPDYDSKRKKILGVLEKTHKQVFCYDYVWETWELKASN